MTGTPSGARPSSAFQRCGGSDINATDAAFVGKIYPKPGLAAPVVHDVVLASKDDWRETEDVEEVDI